MTGMPPESPVSPEEPAAPAAPPATPPATGWAATTEAQPRPGPAAGLAYASVPRRLVALIVDIVLAFIAVIGIGSLAGVLLLLAGASFDANDPTTNIIYQVLALVVTAAYFVLAWRQRRATLGQLFLGLIVGNQDDGGKLSWRAAIIRYVALTLQPIPAVVSLVVPGSSGLVGLLLIGWWIVLLVTTATSPTKQGLHDRWARSLVVRRA